MPAAPVRTAVMTAFPAFSATVNVACWNCTRALSAIVTSAVARLPSTAPPVGFTSSSVTVSSPSSAPSGRVTTVKDLVTSPGWNDSVPVPERS